MFLFYFTAAGVDCRVVAMKQLNYLIKSQFLFSLRPLGPFCILENQVLLNPVLLKGVCVILRTAFPSYEESK